MAGPAILFDKSFLQGLNVDEAVWFDHFFAPVVSPLFYIETLGDLAKPPRATATAGETVRRIAEKFPQMSGSPAVFHGTLWVGNLLGHCFPMDGRPVIAEGRKVTADGQTGTIVQPSLEAQAFERWARGEFQAVEELAAKSWRRTLELADLRMGAAKLRDIGLRADGCRSIGEVKRRAHEFASDFSIAADPLDLVIVLSGADRHMKAMIRARHRDVGEPALSKFAPYAAYALELELFYHLAIDAGVISGERASDRLDIGYLFYLPFCSLFVSADRLHEKCAPHFLRPDQHFIWGPDLKSGLAELDKHYKALPPSEKDRGIQAFAQWPPQDDSFLVSRMYDEYLPDWRHQAENPVELDHETHEKLVQNLRGMLNGREVLSRGPSGQGEFLGIRRSVRKKRGSWYQVPKDLRSNNDN